MVSKLLPAKELADLRAGFLFDGCVMCANSSLWVFCLRFTSVAEKSGSVFVPRSNFGNRPYRAWPSSQPGCTVSRQQLLGASTTWGDETSSVMETIVPLCLGSQKVSFFETRSLFRKEHLSQRWAAAFQGTMETSSCITLTVTGRRSAGEHCWFPLSC